MLGRLYTAIIDAVAISAIQDIFEIVAPSDAIVVVTKIELGQSSDAGDAEEELLRLRWITGFTTSGSGGASVTPEPAAGDTAFGGTVERNNTTVASTGTPANRYIFAPWNVRTPFLFIPTEEELDMFVLSPSARGVLNLPAAPEDAITVSGTISFREIGG